MGPPKNVQNPLEKFCGNPFGKFEQISAKFSKWISLTFFKWIFNIFRWARRALLLGPKGPTVAAEVCSPPQELEKAARRAAIFLLLLKSKDHPELGLYHKISR